MNVADLRGEFRVQTDDTAAPFLWDDGWFLGALNDAVKEAAERALLIEDEDNDNVCLIAAAANVASYDLHPSIIKVRSVTWNGQFLRGISREDLDQRYRCGWKQLTATAPDRFIDPQEKFLTLVKTPTLNGEVRLSVYRRPVNPLVDDEDEPEIHERYHRRLLDRCLELAYAKRDSDGMDPKLSEEHGAAFTASFGVKLDANVLRQQRARRSNSVRMNPTW